MSSHESISLQPPSADDENVSPKKRGVIEQFHVIIQIAGFDEIKWKMWLTSIE